jgi:two-component system, chemotaxis family, protein-glutamate methylesterase/glutaminase
VRRLVAIGASAGGFQALSLILGRLPTEFAGSIAIVQHRRPDESSLLAELLGQRSRLPVVEPYHGTPLRPGHVYVAPADYHLLVEPGSVALSIDPPVNCSRPSIDVLFESAAAAYGRRAVGVVLTGANSDGAHGAARLAAAGAALLVQDPATADAPACPTAALARVPGATVLTITEIAGRLVELCGAAAHAEGSD